MYFIKYQLLLHIVGVMYMQSILKLISSLLVVPRGTPPSPAEQSLHQYVEDGSTYSFIRDPLRILWYIPHEPYHDRLPTHY